MRLAFVVSLLGPAVLYAYLYQTSRQMEIDTTTARLGRVSQIAEEHAQRVVETNEVIYRAINEHLDDTPAEALQAQRAELHERLRRLAAGLGQLQSVWIWDTEGRPVASSRLAVPPQTLRVDDRAYFKAARAARPQDGWTVSEPLLSRSTGEPFFDFARRRSGRDGSFLGVISVSLFPSYFSRFFAEQASQDPAFAVGLLRSDGTVIARHPEVSLGSRLPDTSPLKRAMAEGRTQGSHSGVSSLDGSFKLVSYRKVGELPLYAVAVADQDKVLAPWRRSMVQLAALMLPLSLSLAALAALAIRMVRRDEGVERALREQAEQRLRAEEVLRHSQKLEALGRLTGSVAHDFNNVLMVVQSSASLLDHLAARGQPLERPLGAISRAVCTGSQLTRQLLAFARRQPLKVEVCRLGETLEAMRPLVLSAAGSLVEVSIEIPPDLPNVRVDVAEMELALLNLINNAKDAMPDGGRLWLTASVASPPPGYPAETAGWVTLSVRDAGAGIAPELLDKVLEPFFTTKALGKGTGLGLSQAFGFAEQSGGLLTIDSQPGEGTTVSIHLPGTRDEPDTVVTPAPVSGRLQAHVVLVEDNLEVAAALGPLLTAIGARVTHFASADQALAALQAGLPRPDVLLTDIQMPGKRSGIDLATEVRGIFPDLPTVLMTGYTGQLTAAVALGFTVMSKPVSPERLTQALKEAIAGRPARDPVASPEAAVPGAAEVSALSADTAVAPVSEDSFRSLERKLR